MRAGPAGASGDWQVKISSCANVVTRAGSIDCWPDPVVLADRSLADNAKSPLCLRCYAGQPDPNDPSHFTIAYTFGPRYGVIDGYLHPNNSVGLHARGVSNQ
jgi:hypothetical protein